MINKEQIHKFKMRRELLIDRLKESEEDNRYYYERRLRALALEERDAWKNDLVQPDENSYKTLYRNNWLKMEKEKEEKYFKKIKEKKSRDKFYKDNILEGKAKVMNALNLEDKL